MTAPAFGVIPSGTHIFNYCESHTSTGVKTPSTPANGIFIYAIGPTTVDIRVDTLDVGSEMRVTLAAGQNIFLPYIKIRQIEIVTLTAGGRVSLLW